MSNTAGKGVAVTASVFNYILAVGLFFTSLYFLLSFMVNSVGSILYMIFALFDHRLIKHALSVMLLLTCAAVCIAVAVLTAMSGTVTLVDLTGKRLKFVRVFSLVCTLSGAVITVAAAASLELINASGNFFPPSGFENTLPLSIVISITAVAAAVLQTVSFCISK